ncbi:BamA/TamA family outer membrane protein [Peristeroidobacter soli]|uniref:BamA/TamA family outer membrane protein n=1 Tax=Peristeroidobacter soli TaxID=2497877 RepID=UPI00130064B4|nr:BamA/TamA family outer membrane protein [Peristeroidobacter soli]
MAQFRRILLLAAVSGLLAAALASAESADTVPSTDELERSGAVIGQIVIDAQNVFDTTDPREDKALYRLANNLRIKTRDQVIRRQLLFHPGERYSQQSVDESERILRSARYLYDASIRPIAYHDGVVDLRVTTRDVWTLSPGVSFGRHGGKNTSGFELEELNILGTGTSISLSHKSGIDRSSDELEYKDPHLAGTWASLTANYSNNSDGSTRGFKLDRPFYSLTTRNAFGVAAMDDDRIESLYDRGHVVDEFRNSKQVATAYGGWSAGLVNGWTRRWTSGITYDDESFSPVPGSTPSQLIPEDRRLVYPWIGFELVQDDFVKEHNRDQIGRTEDFHLGASWSAMLGWADRALGSDREALMFATKAGRGFRVGEASTLLLNGALAGRLEEGALHDTIMDVTARYYVPQSKKALFFASIEGVAARNLDLDHQNLLGGDNGLRGYPLRYQAGTSSALLTLEQRYFTDWYPFRLFRIGGAAFFDVGRTWGNNPVGDSNLGLLKDVGVGLRIGNTRSGLGNVIHVDLAFPLDGDNSISNMQLIVETKQQF